MEKRLRPSHGEMCKIKQKTQGLYLHLGEAPQ